ncbi:MAG: undecaprenyl-diphosphate phosphatase [Opitutaceae bacterium]|nr:undecaprenyl-diphosphate phosphatase [Opitutaceae bacterium]
MRKLLLLAFLPLIGFGQSAHRNSPSETPKPAAELSVSDAIILGLIEGVTEFLPISSTGHLIFATHALGLESEQPLLGPDGRPLWHRKPSVKLPKGVPLTLKLAADTYTIVIQFGAIAAVAWLYWGQFLAMARGLLGQNMAGLRLLVSLIVAFFPAAVIGLFAHSWIHVHLFSIGAVVVAQVVGAGLMLYAERWRRRRLAYALVSREPADLAPHAAVGIGLLQCVALWPGTSRSMMVIVGGYFAGFNPRHAAEFSFLLGFFTVTAASGYESYLSGSAMIAVFGWPHVLLGCAVAALAAAAAVRLLVGWLTRHGLAVFAVYRLITATALAAWFLL